MYLCITDAEPKPKPEMLTVGAFHDEHSLRNNYLQFVGKVRKKFLFISYYTNNEIFLSDYNAFHF